MLDVRGAVRFYRAHGDPMACQTSSAPNFRALFESAPGMYLVMTPGFEIVAASDAYLEATRRTRDELVGRTLFDVFFDDPDDSAATSVRRLTASVKRVLADKRADVMAVDRRDRRSWKRVNSPIFGASGEVMYIMHYIEDVTESKDDFLAMLGHELRNPLAAIASATEVLKRTGATTGTAGQSRAVIERQVRHLKRLVDDLVDAARVQGGKVTLDRRPIDLADAVHHAVSVLQGAGESKQHLVEVDAESVGVSVDPTRLEQILVNLLTNAVKFTPVGRAIRVRVQAEVDAAICIVEDEGLGMAPEILPRIFDLFFQGDRTAARTEGGLGIGLTLVKTLTELHGGTVEARTAGLGRGSTFVIRLPKVMIPTAPRRPMRTPGARRRVLVIEDNDDARDMLKTLLTLEGHEVLEARDGADGVRMLMTERPEVALIDIGLPVMDGYEVARTVRRQADHATRLVALTGYGQAEDRQRSYDAGFDDFVVKPVDPARLIQILEDRTATFRW
jgi:PAS domain S-box-containing protein